MQPAFDLAAGAFDFRVSGVTDQDDVVVAAGIAAAFVMHLLHQRTGGIDDVELPAGGIGLDLARYAMGAEHGHGAGWDFVDLVDEDGAPPAQLLDDVVVMNDLMAHIDRRAVLFERAFDDLDGALDPGAEAARPGQDHPQCVGR